MLDYRDFLHLRKIIKKINLILTPKVLLSPVGTIWTSGRLVHKMGGQYKNNGTT